MRRVDSETLPLGGGLLGNRTRAAKLAACRLQLGAPMPVVANSVVVPFAIADEHCPACGVGRLVRERGVISRAPEVADTS